MTLLTFVPAIGLIRPDKVAGNVCHGRDRRRLAVRASSGPEKEDTYDGVRRWLVFGAFSAMAVLGVRVFAVRNLNELDSFLRKRVPFMKDKVVTRAELDGRFISGVFEAIFTVAVGQMNLLSRAELQRGALKTEERADVFFKNFQGRNLSEADTLNLHLYALNHVIAEKTLLKQRRLDYTRDVGKYMYGKLRARSDILQSIEKQITASPLDPHPLLDGLQLILTMFKDAGFSSGFKVDLTPMEEIHWEEEGRANLSIFVDDLVTMTAAQLLAGEEYDDTAPILVPFVISAFMESSGLQVSHEDFYIDNTYQDNPADYRPTGIVSTYDVQVAS
eukprot:Plantae.Rhodophyta-Purpureofilum_apyrenoidigerum.ctg45422.p1 GENE.Plantae.Rhodophyta-Purpureofilum_apyrenoidigerum.ctg45422~~Plantae.Rhodophyta-Purpureofilum_apyrenoidigerum.ctg45422.p1  ORF type:complete len:332 (+),score=59.96 Plantae.Rhodophyta-Purpureofilum_apyrenoidigerum.ctg45422:156-1151(+)